PGAEALWPLARPADLPQLPDVATRRTERPEHPRLRWRLRRQCDLVTVPPVAALAGRPRRRAHLHRPGGRERGSTRTTGCPHTEGVGKRSGGVSSAALRASRVPVPRPTLDALAVHHGCEIALNDGAVLGSSPQAIARLASF